MNNLSSDNEKHIAKKIDNFHKIFEGKTDWQLHSGKWNRLQAKHAFHHSKSLAPTTIYLSGNKQPRLIKHLVQPQMSNLLLLNLKNNGISSIEGLSQFKVVNLKQLLLGDNNISQLRELAKFHAPKLQILSLYANRIRNIQQIYKCNFGNLRTLILGLNGISNSRVFNKCQCKSIKYLSLQNNRICQSINAQAFKSWQSIQIIC